MFAETVRLKHRGASGDLDPELESEGAVVGVGLIGTISPLIEFRPRRDEALGGRYLQGRFGAVPVVDPGEVRAGLGLVDTGDDPEVDIHATGLASEKPTEWSGPGRTPQPRCGRTEPATG